MAYGFSAAITIDHTKVAGGSDLSNFPVLVKQTLAVFKTVGNGGQVQNSNGYDIAFFSDSGLTTQLKHETEKYVASTGEVVYWVKIPTLSHSSDTVIYMAWGDSGVTTDQSDKNNVWDSNFKGVFHLPDGTSLSANDSTSNANNGSITGAVATTGKIGGGGSFDGVDDQITFGHIFGLGATSWVISGWVNLASTSLKGVFAKVGGQMNGASIGVGNSTHDNPGNNLIGGVDGLAWNATSTSIGTGWHHWALKINSSGQLELFLDGAKVYTGAASIVTPTIGGAYFGGFDATAGGGTPRFVNGLFDEIRVSNVARTDGWIETEYNSQSSPSTFYSIAIPDTTAPSDVTLGSTTALSATSARFAFTPATDDVGVAGLNWEFDTVNTFNSGNLIQEFVGSNSSPRDKTGLLAGRRWYGRAKAKDTATPTPHLSTNWSNTVYVDLPPTLNTATPLNNAVIGVPFSQTLSKTGDDGTFEIRSGAPSGMTIDDETGEITWDNPDPLGEIEDIVVRYTVTASGLYAEVTYSITVVPAIITPVSRWSKLNLVPLKDSLFWNALDVAEDAASIGDFSGNGNELEVASSAPVLQTDVINGKPGIYFDGTNNPLKFEAEITLKHLFLVAKFDGATFTGNEGLLSGVAETSILRGNGAASTKFENLSIGSGYVYRKNFVTFTESTQNAPMNSFAILELVFPDGIELDGIQIGQDLDDGDKFKGWFIEQIGYGEVQDDCNRRSIYEYFALKFWLWRYKSDNYPYFPFVFNRSSKHRSTDLAEVSEAEGMRGSDRVVRYLDDAPLQSYDLEFNYRFYLEYLTTVQFLNERRLHLPFWIEDIERTFERRMTRITDLTDNGNGSAYKFDYSFGVKDY
ncbi:MAG TPA: DUF2341 domain-containing protein [Pyrinomonadaceae bacterium]|nr:DUF2341 domain-containing protein [Pyrinomonadaceae bacterium]